MCVCVCVCTLLSPSLLSSFPLLSLFTQVLMEEPTADPTQVNDLVGMGFSTEAAGAALAATNQDFNQVRRERERESREHGEHGRAWREQR